MAGRGRRRIITYNGRSQTVHEWCAETGVSYSTASSRIERGVPDLQAVGLEPYKKRYKGTGRKAGRTSICLDCQNARADRCIWVWRGIPVKGWEATEDRIPSHYGDVKSYKVIRCPNFKGDER